MTSHFQTFLFESYKNSKLKNSNLELHHHLALSPSELQYAQPALRWLTILGCFT